MNPCVHRATRPDEAPEQLLGFSPQPRLVEVILLILSMLFQHRLCFLRIVVVCAVAQAGGDLDPASPA